MDDVIKNARRRCPHQSPPHYTSANIAQRMESDAADNTDLLLSIIKLHVNAGLWSVDCGVGLS